MSRFHYSFIIPHEAKKANRNCYGFIKYFGKGKKMLVCEEKDGEDERIESGILSNVGGILLLYRKQNQNQMYGKQKLEE